MSTAYETNDPDRADDRSMLLSTILSPLPLRPLPSLLLAPLHMSTGGGPQAPAQLISKFDQDWDCALAVRFADYIAYAMREYGVPIPGLFTIVYGPTPASAASSRKTRDYSIAAREQLGQFREDIVRACIVKCVKALGARREVLFSIRLGFVADGAPRTTTLDPERLWREDRWDAAVLGDELCAAAGVDERVWGRGAWESVCELAGGGRGVEYEIRRVR
ncbi:hypothetical protein F5B18DRAFT_233049 [Nemania serpens]|nr:hypothetical protein F5B18DRAFT_233049 [Nemania serpens]